MSTVSLKNIYKIYDNSVTAVSDFNLEIEDKEFIANFYKYAFVGLTLEWVRTGMKDDPAALIERVSTLIHGDITKALEACRIDK